MRDHFISPDYFQRYSNLFKIRLLVLSYVTDLVKSHRQESSPWEHVRVIQKDENRAKSTWTSPEMVFDHIFRPRIPRLLSFAQVPSYLLENIWHAIPSMDYFVYVNSQKMWEMSNWTTEIVTTLNPCLKTSWPIHNIPDLWGTLSIQAMAEENQFSTNTIPNQDDKKLPIMVLSPSKKLL